MIKTWITTVLLIYLANFVASQTGCIQTKLDLVFVVDSSGSIRDANPSDGSVENYNLIKKFMTDIIDNVYAGPQWTRIGVVIFSGAAKNVFFLNSYSTKQEIKNAINGMEYLGSDTNTSGGIRKMHKEQFTVTNGDRPDARNVAIVITDGVSTIDTIQTVPSAEAARQDNIQIYSVGITANINEAELRNISSRPQVQNENYFISTSFAVLSDLVSKLGLGTCVITPALTTTATPSTSPCNNSVVDLVFVIDSSGSIRDNNPQDLSYDNYNLLLEFIVDIINKLTIGPSQSRVGLVLFSNKGKSVFHLNTYSNKAQLIAAVRAVEYIGGNTNTSGALRVMLSESFTSSNGDRPDVDNVAIVITDGVSTIDTIRTISDAKAAHDAGVQLDKLGIMFDYQYSNLISYENGVSYYRNTDLQCIQIYSVGITNNIKQSELRDISSYPHLVNQTYFMSLDFRTLSEVVNKLVEQTCGNNSVSIPGSCVQPVSDVVFLIDSSGSICQDDPNAIRNGGCANYKLLLSFVTDLIKAMSVNNNMTRIGVILFANKADNVFYLNTYSSEIDIMNAVNGLEYKGGNTNTSGAIMRMSEEQFNTTRGDRMTAYNVAIVITDGESTNAADTVASARKAHNADISMYTVGIGNAVNVKELKEMSSAPQQMNRNYYVTADFNTLSELVDVVVNRGCAAAPQGKPTPIPEPENDMTMLYSLLLVAVFVFLVILRGLIYWCQRAADDIEEKEPLT